MPIRWSVFPLKGIYFYKDDNWQSGPTVQYGLNHCVGLLLGWWGIYTEPSSFTYKVCPFFRFLHDLGVPADELGDFITKNPWIFKDELDNLQVRVNYLQSKKFSAEMITRVVRKNPHWLSFRYITNFVSCNRIIRGLKFNCPFKAYYMDVIKMWMS